MAKAAVNGFFSQEEKLNAAGMAKYLAPQVILTTSTGTTVYTASQYAQYTIDIIYAIASDPSISFAKTSETASANSGIANVSLHVETTVLGHNSSGDPVGYRAEEDDVIELQKQGNAWKITAATVSNVTVGTI